jgi:hypothetical protein
VTAAGRKQPNADASILENCSMPDPTPGWSRGGRGTVPRCSLGITRSHEHRWTKEQLSISGRPCTGPPAEGAQAADRNRLRRKLASALSVSDAELCSLPGNLGLQPSNRGRRTNCYRPSAWRRPSSMDVAPSPASPATSRRAEGASPKMASTMSRATSAGCCMA